MSAVAFPPNKTTTEEEGKHTELLIKAGKFGNN
jgi:hypothetical protein